MSRARLTLPTLLLMAGLPAFAALGLASTAGHRRASERELRSSGPAAVYSRVPLHFEANHGQTDPQVKFVTRGSGYSMFLTPTETVVALTRSAEAPGAPRHARMAALPGRSAKPSLATSVVRMKLVGANPQPRVSGEERLAGTASYFRGRDPERWARQVPTYARVRHEGVYPGVDLVHYGDQQQLEYDFVVAPGADPRQIAFAIEGAEDVRLDSEGDLVLKTGAGELRQRRPVVYQPVGGERQEVEGHYTLAAGTRPGATTVAFALGKYDPRRELVIDPILEYSTYLGGGLTDVGVHIAVDAAGSAYAVGWTPSADFPTAGSPRALQGSDDVFVTKLHPSGSSLVYSVFLGGTGSDRAYGVAVDSSGGAYITGLTDSGDFPTVNAVNPSFGGVSDAFVAKLSADGSTLLYSTYHGGGGIDDAHGIDVDAAGCAYVTGFTHSSEFPLVNPVLPVPPILGNVYVSKFDPSGSSLVYSTTLGGSQHEFGHDIAVDAAGSAYITGYTGSTDFPTTPGAFQPAHGGGSEDVFVVKLSPAGSSLAYSTFLGGTGLDAFGPAEGANGITVDAAGNAYVAGWTASTDFPIVNAAQPVYGGGDADAFVAKLNPSGSALVYCTYLGGSGPDFGGGIGVDALGHVHTTGRAHSADFPTVNAVQATFAGDADVFVTKLSPAGSVLVYSTYLGGVDTDSGHDLCLDSAGSAYITGSAGSVFPVANAFQPLYQGNGDGFVAKIADPTVDPCTAIAALRAQVLATNLPTGLERSLIAKLDAACASFDRGNTTAGVNQLGAFIQQVEASRAIDPGSAAAWIAAAQAIIDAAIP
jgi:hypothetical protein